MRENDNENESNTVHDEGTTNAVHSVGEAHPSHDDIALHRIEMRETVTSRLRYPGAARLTEEQELEMLSHSTGESSSSSSSSSASSSASSSSSCYVSSKSLSTVYGPDIYDFIELLHEVHVSYSAAFRDFSPG